MPRVKLGARRQITIPAETIKRLGLHAGEELELVDNGKVITLVPRKHIPKDHEWYYAEEWQHGMQEAFEDLTAGRTLGPFDSAEDAIHALKKAKA